MRSALVGAHGTGTLTRLAEAGIEFTSSGQLKLNGSVFDAAITEGSADVRELFGGTAGAFPDVEALLDLYQQVDGFIPAGKKRLEAQIATMSSQIDAMQRRLAIQREIAAAAVRRSRQHHVAPEQPGQLTFQPRQLIRDAEVMTRPYGARSYVQTQVQSATPLQLVALLYDAAVKSAATAHDAMVQRNVPARRDAINRLMDILTELQGSLDRNEAARSRSNWTASTRICSRG
jgi:hypothetical protein